MNLIATSFSNLRTVMSVIRHADVFASRFRTVIPIVLQPYDVYVYDVYVIKGNTAVFRCHVPSFLVDYVKVTSWVRDSAFVIQSTFADDGKYIVMPTGELYVRDVAANDAMTTFRCQTQHRLTGEVKMSATAGRLFVTEPQGKVQPRVTDSKTSIKANQHDTVVLPCIAQGHPVPAPKWFTKVANGHLLPVYVGDRIHQPNGALVIRDAEVADTGTYVCVISNNASSERIETSVAITAPLTVEVQPSTLLGELGKSATFRCHVSSFPISSLYWLKDGRPLPMPGLSLPTTETVLVESVRLTDRGMFQCMAKRGFESAQGTAELKIGDIIPAFRAVFEERVLQPGPSLTLQCLTYGSPKPQVSWLVEGMILPEGNERSSVRDHVDATGNVVSRLTVSKVRPEDGGVYKCISTNLAGTIEHFTRINIYGRPGVRSRPKMTAVAGDNVMLTCPMYGYPIDLITWEKDGVILPINLRQTVLPNGTLVIEKIQRATDSGKYTCIVQNKQGQSARGDVEVIVMVAPKIIPFSFQDEHLFEGVLARISCVVYQGDLPLTILWMKDGRPISPDLGITRRDIDDYSSILTIEKVQTTHNGNYTCVVSNDAATVNYTAQLTVYERAKVKQKLPNSTSL
uniref:Ig-like domain-containing protein n=2 Tax=Strigamia maritima TaxID=126957 RepID=T1J6W3_STRMM